MATNTTQSNIAEDIGSVGSIHTDPFDHQYHHNCIVVFTDASQRDSASSRIPRRNVIGFRMDTIQIHGMEPGNNVYTMRIYMFGEIQVVSTPAIDTNVCIFKTSLMWDTSKSSRVTTKECGLWSTKRWMSHWAVSALSCETNMWSIHSCTEQKAGAITPTLNIAKTKGFRKIYA
ncbi:hypothetical protein BDZ89DRAFT_1046359 [Hymenopellis radicata]|nr:hypothetical protein BDZ89DRAFT_1046359 [Hymenopellis radicata]